MFCIVLALVTAGQVHGDAPPKVQVVQEGKLSTSVVGYEGFPWGASSATVLQKFPDLAPLPKQTDEELRASRAARPPVTGMMAKAQAESDAQADRRRNDAVYRRPFAVKTFQGTQTFRFVEDKLRTVEIALTVPGFVAGERGPGNYMKVKDSCREIENLLEAKYGDPLQGVKTDKYEYSTFMLMASTENETNRLSLLCLSNSETLTVNHIDKKFWDAQRAEEAGGL